MSVQKSITLDGPTNAFLERIHEKTQINKSKILRLLLTYFDNHPDELKHVLQNGEELG